MSPLTTLRLAEKVFAENKTPLVPLVTLHTNAPVTVPVPVIEKDLADDVITDGLAVVELAQEIAGRLGLPL